eukprot:m.37498 g.37498  ORF g.37498 m.37498 type:complete len:262 (-) comp7707_c0_seq1:493-1278(-)
MIGLWEYYAATVEAHIPDNYAKGDLTKWGDDFLGYKLCTFDTWRVPCAAANNMSCANNQLAGATYIELYKAGLDLPTPHSQRTLQSTMNEFDFEIELGSIADGSWPIVDLTFMAMAPLSRLGAATGDPKYFNKMFANWNASMLQLRVSPTNTTHGSYGLFNFSEGLFMRDDQLLWSNGYWGRAQGWAMLGLIDAIRFGRTLRAGVPAVRRSPRRAPGQRWCLADVNARCRSVPHARHYWHCLLHSWARFWREFRPTSPDHL